jgi:hypothetical protein
LDRNVSFDIDILFKRIPGYAFNNGSSNFSASSSFSGGSGLQGRVKSDSTSESMMKAQGAFFSTKSHGGSTDGDSSDLKRADIFAATKRKTMEVFRCPHKHQKHYAKVSQTSH